MANAKQSCYTELIVIWMKRKIENQEKCRCVWYFICYLAISWNLFHEAQLSIQFPRTQFSRFLLWARACTIVGTTSTWVLSSMWQHEGSSQHTCWVHTSDIEPRPTAKAKRGRGQTRSGSETQARGRQLRSCSWRSRTRPGKTEEGPNRCPRSQRKVVLKAAGAECSEPPHASQPGRQTAAV